MVLNDKLYGILKWCGLIALPAVAWFISQVGGLWGMQNVDAIVATLNAAGTLIGVLIGVSTINYRNGAGNGSGGLK